MTAAPPPAPDPRLMRRFPLFSDMAPVAGRRMPKRLGDYYLGGADSEVGLGENAAAFDRIRLVPRYGLDVTQRSTGVTLFGRGYAAPIGVAPVGYASALWPGSERALAAAAQRHNLPFILSTYSIETLESIIRLAPDVAWFQLYAYKSRDCTLDLVRRAAAAGYRVLVVTLDIPVYSKRTRDHRNALVFPPDINLELLWELARAPVWTLRSLFRPYPLPGNLMRYATPGQSRDAAVREVLARNSTYALTWEQLAELRGLWPGKLVLKGLQHPEDALRALALGADGIIVSNHGGRQLDSLPSAIEMLPEIVDAVGDRAEVILDGGVRRGTDVVKALALGAKACMIGRPMLFGLGAAGESGVERALEILETEIDRTLALLGRPTLADLDRTAVRPAGALQRTAVSVPSS